ncbi:MAG: DUF934 domain-containing protein [Pseudomonadota bacterium]
MQTIMLDENITPRDWQVWDGTVPLAKRPLILSAEQFLAHREAVQDHEGPLALHITPATDLKDLQGMFAHCTMIMLDFPAFSDGRAYSQARQLRGRWQFKGELRASGNILRDQIGFMRRVGIGSLVCEDPRTIAHWQESDAAISVSYQRGAVAANLATR